MAPDGARRHGGSRHNHGPIGHLGIGRTSTVFYVDDFRALKGILLGDHVRFKAVRTYGSLKAQRIEKTDESDDDHQH